MDGASTRSHPCSHSSPSLCLSNVQRRTPNVAGRGTRIQFSVRKLGAQRAKLGRAISIRTTIRQLPVFLTRFLSWGFPDIRGGPCGRERVTPADGTARPRIGKPSPVHGAEPLAAAPAALGPVACVRVHFPTAVLRAPRPLPLASCLFPRLGPLRRAGGTGILGPQLSER